MNPPDSPSSGCTSHHRSSIWDYPSPTDYTGASEGAPSSAGAHDGPAAGAPNLPVGLGVPPVEPVHGFGGLFVPGEMLDPAVGVGLGETQAWFVQNWLDGAGAFGPAPGVDDVQPIEPLSDTPVLTPEQTALPVPVGQDHGLEPSVSSLDVELDDVPPSPILLDTNPSAHDPLLWTLEGMDIDLLGISGDFH